MQPFVFIAILALSRIPLAAQDESAASPPEPATPSIFERRDLERPSKQTWHRRMQGWTLIQIHNERNQRRVAEIDRRLLHWSTLQNPDGSFGTDDSDRLAVTSLTTLAYSLRGHTYDDPDHGSLLRRATEWILDQQRADGCLTIDEEPRPSRSQAIATFTLIDTSYSPEFPNYDYPAIAARAQRSLGYLLEHSSPDDGGTWLVAARAYAVRAGLLPARTATTSTPLDALHWHTVVAIQFQHGNTAESGEWIRAHTPTDLVTEHFYGDNDDDAFFATLCTRSGGHRHEGTLDRWLERESVPGLIPITDEPVPLTEEHLLQTLQIEAMAWLILSKT